MIETFPPDAAVLRWASKRYKESDLQKLFDERAEEQLLLLIRFGERNSTTVDYRCKLPHEYIGGILDFLSFVRDVTPLPEGSMLLCLHDAVNQPLSTEVPVFGFSKRNDDLHTICFPDPYYLQSKGHFDLANNLEQIHGELSWEQKSPICFWRGASTGFPTPEGANWFENPRTRLCLIGEQLKTTVGLDFFLSQLVQCHDASVVKDLTERNLVSGILPIEDFSRNRFLIDIDGNSCSWGFFPKLLMRSVVLKVESDYQQWFYPFLQPGEHFIPIKRDFSDLLAVLEWARSHDAESQQIASHALAFASSCYYVEWVRYFGAQLEQLLKSKL